MRRVVCRQLGDPRNLVLQEAGAPVAGTGQVVLDVGAAGVNFVDALLVTGGYQIKPPVPFTPGTEAAGVISSIGPGVEGWSRGDHVFATTGLGAFAEQVVVGAAALHRIPQGLDVSRAASFAQSYSTMVFAFTRRDRLHQGDQVLVLGSGGGIGLAAIDTAAAMGARVVAAASSGPKLEAARAAGAAETINYAAEDLKARTRELTGGGADVVVDPVGGAIAEQALRSLRQGGRYLVLGFAAGSIPALPLNQVLLNNRSLIGVDWGGWSAREPELNRELLEEILSMVEAGRIHPAAPAVRPLREAGAALSDMLERRVAGKVVLAPMSE